MSRRDNACDHSKTHLTRVRNVFFSFIFIEQFAVIFLIVALALYTSQISHSFLSFFFFLKPYYVSNDEITRYDICLNSKYR